ncbi:MAG: hypothetical protein A2X47_08080 [Lentisphaerae bacterium GWF2_38_69]|nr:MAG: hypothetical protein A2X47_08080 [Lentisphaerae bacterium GWF2_38_69]
MLYKTGKGQLNFGAIPYRENEGIDFYSDSSLFNSLFGNIQLTPFEIAINKTILSFKNQL